MQSETEKFVEFVEFLKLEEILNAEQIDHALKFLDGVDGVVAEKYFIFGYENIAHYLSENLSFHELRTMASKYVEVFVQDADARYFFCQAFVEKPSLSEAERRSLINCMPEKFQPLLLKRFFRNG